jgi:membrane protein insertase Oxa1/YidC/SpoIIIJ
LFCAHPDAGWIDGWNR